MPKVVETLLTSVGLPAEDIAKIVALPEEEQEKFDVSPYAEKVKGNYQTQFKNDPAFFKDLTLDSLPPATKKILEGEQYGRLSNVGKDKLLKGLGMSEADFEDVPEEQRKRLETFVPIALERWTKKNSGAKDVQEQLIAERKKNEDYQKKYGPDYEKEVETKHQTAADVKVTAAIFNAALIGELSAIPGLKIPATDIAATANGILQSKYGFERVGDYSVELRQKANPQMKVLKNGSSQELTLKDALLEIATERNWIEKPQVSTTGTGTAATVIPNNNGQLEMVVAPHIKDKISKKIASEK